MWTYGFDAAVVAVAVVGHWVAAAVAELVVTGEEEAVVVWIGVADGAGEGCPCGRWGKSADAGTKTAGKRRGRCGCTAVFWHLHKCGLLLDKTTSLHNTSSLLVTCLFT